MPVAKAGDYVQFQPTNAFPEVYQVIQVEPMQQWILDYLQIPGALPSSVHTLSAVGTSSNDRTSDLSNTALINYFATEDNIFVQWRVDPVDDILLKLGGNAPYFSTQYTTTYIQKRLPRHTAVAYITTAPGTDTLIWANTNGQRIGGMTTSNYPTRKSRIIGLAIDTAGSVTVYLGDAGVAGGTAATATDHVLSPSFIGPDYQFFGLDSLPEGLVFEEGIVAQISGAVATNITVVVEEDQTGIFGGQLLAEQYARANNENEFYTFQDTIPVMTVLNPLAINQTTARVALAGFMFGVVAVDRVPAGVKPIGLPLQRISRST